MHDGSATEHDHLFSLSLIPDIFLIGIINILRCLWRSFGFFNLRKLLLRRVLFEMWWVFETIPDESLIKFYWSSHGRYRFLLLSGNALSDLPFFHSFIFLRRYTLYKRKGTEVGVLRCGSHSSRKCVVSFLWQLCVLSDNIIFSWR